MEKHDGDSCHGDGGTTNFFQELAQQSYEKVR